MSSQSDKTSRKVLMYIDSSDRDSTSTSASDCTITLSHTVSNVKQIRIDQLTVPFSWYPINNNTNTLTIVDAKAVSYTITLDNGSYDSKGIVKTLSDALNAAASDLGTWIVSINDSTCKMTISTDNNFYIDNKSTLRNLLGFVSNPIQTASQSTLVGDSLVSLDGPDYLFLTSVALSTDYKTSFISSDAKKYDINTTNNSLTVVDNTTQKYTITIPSGVYTISTLMVAIATSLNTNITTLNTWSVIYNSTTNYVTISTSSVKTFYIDRKSSLAPLLGFSANQAILASSITGLIKLSRLKNTNVVKKILVNKSFSERNRDYIVYLDDNEFTMTRNLSVLDFQLRYPDDTIVDLNGLNWSCTITLFSNN